MNSQASKKKRPPVHTGLIIRYYAELYKMDGSMFARRGYLLSFSSQQISKVIINITHDIHKNIIFAVEKAQSSAIVQNKRFSGVELQSDNKTQSS